MKYFSVCTYLSLVLLYLVPAIPADIVVLGFGICTACYCVCVCACARACVREFYFATHSHTQVELQKRRVPNQGRTVSCGLILSASKKKREVRDKFS